MCVQVQLGMRTKLALSLYNDEALPFSFALDKASYDASDALLAASVGKPLLDVQPVSGTVPPKSKVGNVDSKAGVPCRAAEQGEAGRQHPK
jgi:hypothetical protein